MFCPHCKKEYETAKNRVFFCPYCQSILDMELMTKSLPKHDKQGNQVEEYIPDKIKVQKHGTFRWEDEKRLRNENNDFLSFIVPLAILLVSVVGIIFTADTYPISIWIGCITGSFALITLLSRFVITKKKNEYIETCVPIRFYGNEQVFGFTTIPFDSNDSEELPKMHFVEIKKEDILGVDYNDYTNCQFISLRGEINIGDGNYVSYIEIPNLFDEELFDIVYGKHESMF